MPSYSQSKFALFFSFFIVIIITSSTLLAQDEVAIVHVETRGKFIRSNVMVMVVSVDIPKGWKLNVGEGFEGMWEGGIDTVSIALKFKEKPEIKLVERWKADRKPSEKGFYYENITFAQTIKVDTSKLPIFIDAELRWSLMRMDEKQGNQGKNCCLLEVCKKRKNIKTISVGWNCGRREGVYLEDYKKE